MNKGHTDHDGAHASHGLEGPAGYNGSNGPGGALKLPTKHYPASTAMATKGKKTSIEGPCQGKTYGNTEKY